jgi:peroxiredoxin
MDAMERRERRSRWIRGVILTVAILGIGAIAWSRRGEYAPLDIGRLAPDYRAVTLNGDTLGLDDLRGRVVLLNIWATWCRPCVREMPALQTLHDRLGAEGLTVLAVSVDNASLAFGDPASLVHNFASEFRITFPILLDPDNRIESVFPVGGLPMTYLIGRDGRIRGKFLGPREWAEPEIESEIRSLLES